MKKNTIRVFFLTLILIGIGMVMIFSASGLYASELFDDQYYFLKKQLLSFFIGFVLFLTVMKVDYRQYKKISASILIFAMFLLLMVFIPGVGKTVGGARRWIHVFGFGFQPSEFAKIALIIYLADYLDKKKDKISLFWNGLCPPLFIIGLLVGMVHLQPDFGTMVLMSAVSILMLFVGGVLLRYLGALFLAVLPALYLAVWNVPYRRQRVMTFLDPWNDPGGSGYQVIQSLVALGSGGLFGVGLGQSRQKLFYLPEAHTDFIFSIIGEEIGLIGSLSIIVIFLYLFWNGLMIVWNTKDPFGYYLGLGIVSLICLQTFIHIGVVTNSLPPKGIPLPFISFGGSSLVINMISMGILISIGKHQPGHSSKRRRKLSTF